jgi:ELWxxDGT repeat protein
LTVAGEFLFFASAIPPDDRAVWVTDGTHDGTRVVHSKPGIVPTTNLTELNGVLLFFPDGGSTSNRDLWRSDGTNEGTFMLEDINGALSSSTSVLSMGNIAYLGVTVGGRQQLWKTNGTEEGTILIKEFGPTATPGTISELEDINGTLFFTATLPAGNRGLWKSDGTEDGTILVKSFSGIFGSRDEPLQLMNFKETLHFTARSAESGFAIWKSDGTEAGTVPVIDVAPQLPGLPIAHLRDVGGTLIFAADDGVSGMEIWKSDGTDAGTVRIKDIVSGPSSSSPTNLLIFGNQVLFAADDGLHGWELWKTDGTEAGTSMIADLYPGATGSAPSEITDLAGTIYFSANDLIHGREPHVLRISANEPSASGATILMNVQSQIGLVVTRNAADGSEVSHVKITAIANGTLYLRDGVTEVVNGQFVPFEEAARGFRFTPAEGFTGTASFKVQASTSASDAGLGGEAVTANIAVLPRLGTAVDDDLTLRASSDGTMLEVYSGNPPTPGATPIFSWPMDASVPLLIDTLGGSDSIYVELPPESQGPAGGVRFEGGEGADALYIRSGIVRLGGGASVIASLTIDAGATLDITDNALVIDYAGTSPVATVREKILSGRGGAGLGKPWNGTGITSSTAAETNRSAPESRSVGYAENALLPLGAYSTFRGQTVDATSVLIAYTRTGDANLDGVVDNDDVTIVGANYAPGAAKPAGSAWALGDFDYNGFVDNDDVTLLGVFYQTQGAAPPPSYELPITKDEGGITNYEGRITKDEGVAVRMSTMTTDPPAARDELGRVEPGTFLQGFRIDGAIETFGQEAVWGRETRSQHGTRAQQGTGARQGRESADDALVGLLAEAIAADSTGASYSLADRRLAAVRRAHVAESLFGEA